MRHQKVSPQKKRDPKKCLAHYSFAVVEINQRYYLNVNQLEMVEESQEKQIQWQKFSVFKQGARILYRVALN